MTENKILSTVTKTLIKNVIRHTDSHNKVVEESEMWRQREKEIRGVESRGSSYRYSFLKDRGVDMRYEFPVANDRRAHMDEEPRSTYWMKQLYKAEENDKNRWGHSGFKELYPEHFESSDYSSSPDEKHRVKNHKDRHKKKKLKKKKKRKRKHSVSDTDSNTDENKHKKKSKKKHKDDSDADSGDSITKDRGKLKRKRHSIDCDTETDTDIHRQKKERTINESDTFSDSDENGRNKHGNEIDVDPPTVKDGQKKKRKKHKSKEKRKRRKHKKKKHIDDSDT